MSSITGKKTDKSVMLLHLFKKVSKNIIYYYTWCTAYQWIQIIKLSYPDCAVFDFTKGDLTKVVAKDPEQRHFRMTTGYSTNDCGIYFDNYWIKNNE